MRIDIDIDRRSMRWIDTSPSFIKKSVDTILPDLALFLEGEAKQNFNGVDQLKVRTGNLRRSIVGEVSKDIASIGTDVVYGRIHELGGPMPGGWKMRKRPYLEPAFTDNVDKVEDMLLDAMIKEWRNL